MTNLREQIAECLEALADEVGECDETCNKRPCVQAQQARSLAAALRGMEPECYVHITAGKQYRPAQQYAHYPLCEDDCPATALWAFPAGPEGE